jgi:hypothetical protein
MASAGDVVVMHGKLIGLQSRSQWSATHVAIGIFHLNDAAPVVVKAITYPHVSDGTSSLVGRNYSKCRPARTASNPLNPRAVSES